MLLLASPGREHAPLRKHDALGQHFELFRRRADQHVARAPGGLQRRVAHHQGYAARVRTEVDRRDAGIAGDAAHFLGADAQGFRDDRGEHIVRALTDFGRAAEYRHLAAAIEGELHARSAASCSSRSKRPRRTCTNCRQCRRRGLGAACRAFASSRNPRPPAGCIRPGRCCRS